MKTRCYSLLFAIVFSLMLNACGFQLRGQDKFSIPFHTLSLEANQPYSKFINELKKALETAGVYTPFAPATSPRLQVLAQNYTRTPTSLGDAGQTTTYLLAYRILFQLIDCKGHVLLKPQSVQATRTFSITSNQLTGDLNTENDLRENMQQDIIQQLLIRLASPDLRQQFRCSTCSQS
jgi:LPS-assembly lipoprotein